MRVSEVTPKYLADYMRYDELEESEHLILETVLKAAMNYVKSYTGLSEEEIDKHEDITIAVIIIAVDMFENRNLYLDYKYREMNKAVECILNMHSINLL